MKKTSTIEPSHLIEFLRQELNELPDKRTGKNIKYQIAEATMAAFSAFCTQLPSFLEHQRFMKQQKGKDNASSLFGLEEIPFYLVKTLEAIANAIAMKLCRGAMTKKQCSSCATLNGSTVPPEGILYDNGHWVVFLRAQPLLVPGQGFIVLKRHCGHLSELTQMELASLGLMLQQVQDAYDRVLQPAKIHFGLYAEDVKHIHLHIIPRMPTMPAGNIPLTFLHVWTTMLASLRLKRPFSDATVGAVGERLRQAFAVISINERTNNAFKR